MPHTVSFIQDDKDPSVFHEFLINVGPLGIKEEPDKSNVALRDRSLAMLLQHPSVASTASERCTRPCNSKPATRDGGNGQLQ